MYGCSYEVLSEDDMAGNQLQQRSKQGSLVPGSQSKINFQLAYLLDAHKQLDPGNYTIDFSVFAPPVTDTYVVKPKAEILWMVGGNNTRRVIDVSNGAAISGVAEGVTVNIFDESFFPAPVSNPPAYNVAFQIAKGSRASIQQPPVYSLEPSFSAGAGAISTTNLPANIGAVSVSIVVSPLVAGTSISAYDILVLQSSGTTTRKSYDPRQDQWVPLAAGADNIQILTSAACPAFNYQLTFGIDG
jgi:hypothetical protein